MRNIATHVLAVAVLGQPLTGLAQQPAREIVSVQVDPRAELLAIVFRLAGNPEYNMGRVPAYSRAIDAHFQAVRNHPTVVEARRLRFSRGVGFDAVMHLAIHMTGIDNPTPRRTLTSPDLSLDGRWTPDDAGRFMTLLGAFVRDSKFHDFMDAQRPLLDSAGARLGRVVREEFDVAWLVRFFGTQPNGVFIAVPLVANGAGNFGPRYIAADSTVELYGIIGSGADSTGFPSFNARYVPTIVHEFSHSFVNRTVEGHAPLFRDAVPTIYPKVGAQMRAQAYGNWSTMLNESLVRVSVARYLLAHGGEAAARREVTNQQANGFVWMDELFDLFAEYEGDRARYPTFESFLPRVGAFYENLVTRADSVIARFDRTRPQLRSATPANNATTVDPILDRIVLEFDRPMGPGMNINVGPGGRATFPEITRTEWSPDSTRLTLFVTLKPATAYELSLGGGFRSRENAPLKTTVVRFQTRP
jgi:hypothetical protein